MSEKTYSLMIGDSVLSIDVGKLAQQCNGSCILTYGDTQVLATCAISREPREGINFLPLMVNYQEKYYASGIIGGNRFTHREARPPIEKIIMGRLIDRGIRPMLPKDLRRDIQVMLTVLSYDNLVSHDILSANAASLAVSISDCPFDGPLGTVRVGMVGGELVLNPNEEVRKKSDLDLVVTSNIDNVVMIELQGNEIPEDQLLKAIEFGKKWGQKIARFFMGISKEIGKPKFEVPKIEMDKELEKNLYDVYHNEIYDAIYNISGKIERYTKIKDIIKRAEDDIQKQDEEKVSEVALIIDKIVKEEVRKNILEKNIRIAKRGIDEIRSLRCELDMFKRTHGSAMFQRGETQGVTVTTLGGPGDVLIVDGMEGEYKKRYFHHYNFPPYSVGEVSNRLGVGNREIGHGNLAEKAIEPVLPSKEEFPYIIRTVTEIMQSNGSSSMAATCGSTLSLMAAGVPIKAPVAGIALGLMSDPEKKIYKILTDLQDEEDFGGDMDFKVTGTKKGVTALQMDIKIKGLPDNIFKEALEKARIGRMKILEVMLNVISEPRKELSQFAPRLYSIKIDVDQIKIVIGKGGETINKIIDETGVTIDIADDGEVVIASKDSEKAKIAVEWIKKITEKPEVGKIYDGKVKKILDFGALVEILPNIEGMVHISMMTNRRLNKVTDFINIGDPVKVKLLSMDNNGKYRLSMKDVK